MIIINNDNVFLYYPMGGCMDYRPSISPELIIVRREKGLIN